MKIGRETIENRSTDAVFERGENYRTEGRIQRLDRFETLISAAVSGSKLYDVTVDFGDQSIDTRCTCPYDGSGDCKHVVAVLLAVLPRFSGTVRDIGPIFGEHVGCKRK
jgi:uncharacterized Zn finger protein